MADPGDLAKQAFSMLQSALASSEARAEKLNEELARKPVSKDKLENKVSVLSHRLESIEEECARWRRETQQLEEVLANERAKFDTLKKKLEIAESGPDKLTKKEINYWRANAGKLDQQINIYKSRITALKRDLREKEQLLESGHPSPLAAELSGNAEPHDAEALSAAQTEIENLRQQIICLNTVSAETHANREHLESEVVALREHLEAVEREAQSQTTEDTGLAAELERVRTENAELRSSLQGAEKGLEELRRAHQNLEGELSELERVRTDNTELRSSLQLSEAGLHELRRAREDLASELAEFKYQVEGERSQHQDSAQQQQILTAKLEEARSRESALQNDLDATRQALADREQRQAEASVPESVTEELKAELARAQQEAGQLQGSLSQSESKLAELRDTCEEFAAELAELHGRIDNEQAGAAEAGRRQQAALVELNATREREATLRAQLDEINRASEGREHATQALNDAIAAAEQKAIEADAIVAELRAELKDEKEYSENLSELANSRQDKVIKLQDGVDEANERLEDALWRLDKAMYFQRLVARRKGLITSLIAALRGKNKAMVALKAGLDSLRTNKAMVEGTQQKLLMRLETVKNELGVAKARIKELEAAAATIAQQPISMNDGEVAALQERLVTQAELIQSLENDVKAAKIYKHDAAEKNSEVEQLHEELETKNTIIARLQSDLDEQQRKLAKLRGSESETVRLKAISEKDRSTIDILERENAELRAMIESAEQSSPKGSELTDAREAELQAKIAELSEAQQKWKRKYEFLAAEAPAAYQSQTAAKQ